MARNSSSGGLSDAIPKTDLIAERDARLGRETDSETCMELLAHYQRAIMFRVAVSDFSDELPVARKKTKSSMPTNTVSAMEAVTPLRWDTSWTATAEI